MCCWKGDESSRKHKKQIYVLCVWVHAGNAAGKLRMLTHTTYAYTHTHHTYSYIHHTILIYNHTFSYTYTTHTRT